MVSYQNVAEDRSIGEVQPGASLPLQFAMATEGAQFSNGARASGEEPPAHPAC